MNIFNAMRRRAGNVTINGRTYVGDSISISNGGVVTVDGVVQDGAALVGPITVNIVGDVEHVTNTSGNINVTGDANLVTATSGDINVKGDVKNNASTTSGDIECREVHGGASTVSGDISRKFLR